VIYTLFVVVPEVLTGVGIEIIITRSTAVSLPSHSTTRPTDAAQRDQSTDREMTDKQDDNRRQEESDESRGRV